MLGTNNRVYILRKEDEMYNPHVFSGEPNDRMFPNMLEVSQMVFSITRGLFGQFGVALKTIYLFGCFRGTLAVTKVLGNLGTNTSPDHQTYLPFRAKTNNEGTRLLFSVK